MVIFAIVMMMLLKDTSSFSSTSFLIIRNTFIEKITTFTHQILENTISMYQLINSTIEIGLLIDEIFIFITSYFFISGKINSHHYYYTVYLTKKRIISKKKRKF